MSNVTSSEKNNCGEKEAAEKTIYKYTHDKPISWEYSSGKREEKGLTLKGLGLQDTGSMKTTDFGFHLLFTGKNISHAIGLMKRFSSLPGSADWHPTTAWIIKVGKNVGLGLVLTNDALGPANEFFIDGNFSYTLRLNDTDKRLSFGLKAGGRLFNVDFTEGSTQNPDIAFQNNIENKFFPTIGAGVYYHNSKGYLGLAVPNFFSEEHYNGQEQVIATERLHYFLIGGKIFIMTPDVQFKPAFFVKWVPGAPIIADISANAMIRETLTFGVAYRWDDSFSGLFGLQISPDLSVGYAYDLTTTDLTDYTSGTHEIFLRYEFKTVEKRLKSPRFY